MSARYRGRAMLVLGIAVVAALLIPLVTLGSYKRLFETKLHWTWLLAASLAIQLGLEFYSLPHRYWDNIGYGVLVGSYVLLLAFIARNLVLRGMSIVLIGIACNGIVITLNQGMPVKIPPEWRNESWAKPTVKHHPRTDGDRLLFLSDIIIVRHPLDNVLSFGDLILAIGLCDVAYNASRDPRRAKRKAQRRVARLTSRS
ncbi:MAG: hypothetical protein QOG50_3543 [Actinomycetota bacterium]|nr:hypothetical protein [Actinomycetota bacterium]